MIKYNRWNGALEWVHYGCGLGKQLMNAPETAHLDLAKGWSR